MPRKREMHGATKTREYRIWKGMINRCHCKTSTGFAKYGALGIAVCDSWRISFSNFIRDLGPMPSPTHSLDRISPEGNYAPGNCRWATPTEQQINKRKKPGVFGIEGVFWNTYRGRYQIFVGHGASRKQVGTRVDFFEACCLRKSKEAVHLF